MQNAIWFISFWRPERIRYIIESDLNKRRRRHKIMKQEPYIDMDVHGLTAEQAIEKIETQIKKANASTYRLRIVHGYHRGNSIQKAIYREFGHGLNPKVLRIVGGDNPGITELVLREY